MTFKLYLEPRSVTDDYVELSARLEQPTHTERLWWRVPLTWSDALTTWADPFVVGLIFPIMQAGVDVFVDAPVSPSLLANLERFMALWHAWVPDRYYPIEITAAEEVEPPA